MTRIDKTPEQLAAEADAPKRHLWCMRPGTCTDLRLPHLIETARELYRHDLFIPRLTTESPPVFIDPQTGRPEKEVGEEDDAGSGARVGLTLSWPLTQYLSDQYGRTFPWSKGAFRVWVNCRRTHPEHSDRPEFRGSLCRELVGLVIRQDFILERACLKLGLTPERAGRTLRNALLGIEAEMQRTREKAERNEREDAGLGPGAVPDERPTPCHHGDCRGRPHFDPKPHPDHEWHRAECPQCQRRAA